MADTQKNNPKIEYFELGKNYFYQNDMEKAKQYFQISSDYGNKKATYNLATIYAKEKNYKKAYPLFLKAATNNYPQAQNKVGLFLLYGWGIEKDYKEAVKWFEYAYFKNKYIPAVCNLSYMYANGYGVMFNFGRAAKLARIGIKENLPQCKKVYSEYKLDKYKEDKGFQYRYYSD